MISVAPLYSEKVYPEMLDHELLSNPDQVNANELLPERCAPIVGVSKFTEGA